MIASTIQRQVPIGSRVTVLSKDGRENTGVLTELSLEHITLKQDAGFTTIRLAMIGQWEVQEDKQFVKSTQSIENDTQNELPATTIEDGNTESSNQTDSSVLRKLLEIEAHFQVQLQKSSLKIIPADFAPVEEELHGQYTRKAMTIWERAKNQYEYTLKINELGRKFGRIQGIIRNLETLLEWFPESPSVNRQLAYLHWLSEGKHTLIQQLYRQAATSSRIKDDWHNLAAIALENGAEELACYGLDQYFRSTRATENSDAWHVYIRLISKFHNYDSLKAHLPIPERVFSPSEVTTLLETSVYLLKVTKQEQNATDLIKRWQEKQSPTELVLEAFSKLTDQPSEDYQQFVLNLGLRGQPYTKQQPLTTIDAAARELLTSLHNQAITPPPAVPSQSKGYVYHYRPDKGFGFIKGPDSTEYFFHRSAIVDEELAGKLANRELGQQTRVVFETTQGKKGPIAVRISLSRTVQEMFGLAERYANEGEYAKAISQVQTVLAQKPEFPQAQENYEKWREYERVAGVPRGKNPFAQAKRVQLLEKDLNRAIPLFQRAIEQGDNVESAIKDLSTLLYQQGRIQEAIAFLQKNRNKITSQQSVDNLLIGFYQKAEQYDDAIELLNIRLKQVPEKERKILLLTQIANCYFRQGKFLHAEETYETALKMQPSNIVAIRRNVAMCLFHQERIDDAEAVLRSILDEFPDVKSVELLESINQTRETGQTDRIWETAIAQPSTEISEFTQFFLQRCDFRGVPSERVQNQQFSRHDIDNLVNLAKRLGTKRPRDRSDYYLSAARLITDLDEDPNLFHPYLVRSLTSLGDAAVVENRPLDTAQELYSEALAVYNVYNNDRARFSESDVDSALARYLYATMERPRIKTEIPSIAETIEEVILQSPDRDRVFDAISYLISRSRYAAQKILRTLHTQRTLQALSLEFLNKKGISTQKTTTKLDDFVDHWKKVGLGVLNEIRVISEEIRLLRRTDFTPSILEEGIQRISSSSGQQHRWFYDLDRQRMEQVRNILAMALDQCKQVAFEEQERLCIKIDTRCDDIIKEIIGNPTKLSVEEIRPVAEAIKQKAGDRLEELYRDAVPQLNLRLAIETFPSGGSQPLDLDIQIVIANDIGRSPAEALELIFPQEDSFTVMKLPQENIIGLSLRGGEQKILRVSIRASKQAIESQAFSLPVLARYRTRSGDTLETPVKPFSIRLNSDTEFEHIDNPYTAYAEGGIVDAPDMFYGRQELIENIASVMQASHVQSKSVIIFGQKRSGKSSTLHHLKQTLESCRDLLVLDLGNIGSILDDHTIVPFEHQILWLILAQLKYAIEDKEEKMNFTVLDHSFPSAQEFYKHPTPNVHFKELFHRFKHHTGRSGEWHNVRVVLLIDEFSYIHDQLVDGYISSSFMKTWKALLQEGFFNVVLVGQDVMPKFKNKFPNEFGTTQDERVTYLREEDAKKLIDEPIRIGGRQGESRYREQAMERILALTAGSPFYIQIICNRLVEYMNRKQVPLVTSSDVEQVKEELIRGVNALGRDKFDNLINSGDTSPDAICDEDTLKVLRSIAINSQAGPCSRSSINCETSSSIETVLEDLVHREVIERERTNNYQIRVGLFKEWLIAHPS